MNITEAELKQLENTKSEDEWNDTCTQIKKARNGMYPPDWWAKVMVSGMGRRVMEGWSKPGTPDIQVTSE